jgi:hypothetical protein
MPKHSSSPKRPENPFLRMSKEEARKYGHATNTTDGPIAIQEAVRVDKPNAEVAFNTWFRQNFGGEPVPTFEPEAYYKWHLKRQTCWHTWRYLAMTIFEGDLPFEIPPHLGIELVKKKE